MTAFEEPLQLFTGKGGVGKTTLAAALALALARRGRRPLLVELGHRASLEGVLSSEAIGYEPSEVAPGVFAMNLTLEPALQAFVAEQLRSRRLASTITQSRLLSRLFQAAPGVVEVLTIDTLGRHVRSGRFDTVLVDLDATGHALMLLELPRVLSGLLGPGRLRRALNAGFSLLTDENTTRLHLVAVPEPLVVSETLELHRRLATEHAVPLGAAIVNRVPQLDVGELRKALEAPLTADDRALVERLLARSERSLRLCAEVSQALGPTLVLPDLGAEPLATPTLLRLGDSLLKGTA